MQVIRWASRIAHDEGFKPIRNTVLEGLLWGRTGYPAFWMTSNPLQECEQQLRQALQEIRSGKSKEWEPL